MRIVQRRSSIPLALRATLVLLASGAVSAENIDPVHRYAWSENLGWINAQPSGPGGPGLQVSDGGLTGMMWAENAGWISVSGSGYGVVNDGCGVLSGYAWSENTGWINFTPTNCGGDPTCGVKIDPSSGNFSGRAWSENAGWITFAATGPNAYRVATSWRRSAPPGATGLTAAKSGSDLVLSWAAVAGAATYDIVRGSLSALRSSSGNFQSATQACVADNSVLPSVTVSATPGVGDGYWLLVRAVNCGGGGTYDSGAAKQVGSRDAEIRASGSDCP